MSREDVKQQNPLRGCVALSPVTPEWPSFLILLLDTYLLVFEKALSVILSSIINTCEKESFTILVESHAIVME